MAVMFNTLLSLKLFGGLRTPLLLIEPCLFVVGRMRTCSCDALAHSTRPRPFPQQ